MDTPLRVLIVEDSKDDAFFLLRELQKGGFQLDHLRVDSADTMQAALNENEWDLIISDFRMPGFDGLSALEIYHEADLDIPFILVSGTIGEDVAVKAMRSGAHDYLMKDNLTRLVPAIRRELQETESRIARRKAEEALRTNERKYRHLFQNAPSGIYEIDLTSPRFIRVNDVMCEYTGYTQEEFLALNPIDLLFGDSQTAFFERQQRLLSQELVPESVEYQVRRKDGSIFWALLRVRLVRDAERLIATVVAHDITNRKLREIELRQYSERLKILRDLDRAILQAESPQTIAQAAFEHIRELVPHMRASVMEFDFDNDSFTILAAATTQATNLTQGKRIPLGGITNLVQLLSRGELHVVDDIEHPPFANEMDAPLKAEGIRSYICFPLFVQDELIGSLNIGADQTGVFTDEHIDMVYDIANLLAVAIQQARLFERIRSYAGDLELRVAERTEELQIANAHLAALSRVKDEFVSNVSHELRTPIANIKVQRDLFHSGSADAEGYLEIMEREIERLEHLVEDLLSLSRLDQDGYAWNPATFDLETLCNEYVLDRLMLAANRNIRLRFERSPRPCNVHADQDLIGQVISILLNNAIQYTQIGGEISIQTLEEETDLGTWAGFQVCDDGPGIPRDEQPQVFERFYRGNAGRLSDMPGTGLGLAIAREIVERHHGHINITSPLIEGRGTMITVMLPSDSPLVE
jgi:PAS domain S-box-containing protein